jgi:UDP-N-acetylglucosamine 4,6-dehydratase
MLDDASILITGGTGSFGNAFVRYALDKYKVRRIVVYSRDEYKQFVMQNAFKDERLRFFIGDVRDEDRLSFAMRGITHVFHAAAMKQVVASEYNPIECVNTNVLGSENVIRTAIRAQVRKVLAVSTDKAVKPINLYGSTKACMERLMIAANHLAGAEGTRFAVARYGNVIGSRGSVVPVFREQAKSGKITITDERMTRFWLRIEEGVDFVDRCAAMMHGGEIFVKRIPSMRINDLAAAVAPDCKIDIVGIRPGEKLHEAMVSEEESLNAYSFKDFYVIQPSIKMWEGVTERSYEGQRGDLVDFGFSYSSDNNTDWLDVPALRALIDETEVVSH